MAGGCFVAAQQDDWVKLNLSIDECVRNLLFECLRGVIYKRVRVRVRVRVRIKGTLVATHL
jgi:hypothetical protein